MKKLLISIFYVASIFSMQNEEHQENRDPRMRLEFILNPEDPPTMEQTRNDEIPQLRETSKRFVCIACGQSYATMSELDIHLRSNSVRGYVCDWPGCTKRFFSKKSLSLHRRAVHLKECRFTCYFPGCGKAFFYQSHFSRHVKNYFK